jgi:hypothetical protein
MILFAEAVIFLVVYGGGAVLALTVFSDSVTVVAIVIFGIPMTLGLLFGYSWGNKNIIRLAFVICAIASGLMPLHMRPFDYAVDAKDIGWLFVAASGEAILVCGFAAVGDWLYRKRHPGTQRETLAGRVARRLIRNSSLGPEAKAKRTEEIKATLVAYSPLITLIGTVIGAVLTLVGAIYKPTH